MRASHINNLPSAIISPLARYSKFLSLTFACAAGTYFRYTTKVGKDVPKKGKTTVRSGFLPFLWNLSHLSTDRASPPRINARGLTDTISYRGSRAVGAVEIETSTSRRLPNAIDNVRHRTLFVRRRSAIGRKIGGIPKGGKKTAPNGCLRQLVAFSLIWCAFAYFRRIAKVSARRAGET